MSGVSFVVDHMSWLRTIKWNERSLGTPLESKVCTHTPLLSANGVHGLVPGQQRNATVISPGGSVAIPGRPMVATKAPLLTSPVKKTS